VKKPCRRGTRGSTDEEIVISKAFTKAFFFMHQTEIPTKKRGKLLISVGISPHTQNSEERFKAVKMGVKQPLASHGKRRGEIFRIPSVNKSPCSPFFKGIRTPA
jgi:hypothetical protein